MKMCFLNRSSCQGRRVKVNFTLIELLVSTVISSLYFFTRQSACETKQKVPLFFERERGRGGKGKPSFPARSAGCEKTRPSVFVSLRRDESLRWGSDISSQRSPLFFERERGGEINVFPPGCSSCSDNLIFRRIFLQ